MELISGIFALLSVVASIVVTVSYLRSAPKNAEPNEDKYVVTKRSIAFFSILSIATTILAAAIAVLWALPSFFALFK